MNEITPTQSEAVEAETAPAVEAEATEAERVFDAEYVGKLRQEAAEARMKAKRTDALSSELLKAWTALDGRLIDPEDLTLDKSMLNEDGSLDRAKVTAALDALIERKPHLAARRPVNPLPQGATPESEPVNLAALLRART